MISWIAEQSWCSGRVGMMGFSWGGFAALQVAALRPPNLAAIIPCYFTDNRYTDDAHYLGGCVLASEMLSWSTTMLAYTALPPDPETVMEAWEETWRERLQALEPPCRQVAFAPGVRRLLASRFCLRGLLGHRLPGLCHWWLCGRLQRSGSPPPRGTGGTEEGAARALGALLHYPFGLLVARALGSCRSACDGGTGGSKTRTPASWRSPCFVSGCPTSPLATRPARSGLAAGSASQAGPLLMSRTSACG